MSKTTMRQYWATGMDGMTHIMKVQMAKSHFRGKIAFVACELPGTA